MQITKERITKEDGRYLIYYTFTGVTPEGAVAPCKKVEPENTQIDLNPRNATEGKG